MGEALLGGLVGERPGLGAHGRQVQRPAGGTDRGLCGGLADGDGGAHHAPPAASNVS